MLCIAGFGLGQLEEGRVEMGYWTTLLEACDGSYAQYSRARI